MNEQEYNKYFKSEENGDFYIRTDFIGRIKELKGVALRNLLLKVTGQKKITNRYIPDKLKWDVFERDNFTCVICGKRKFLSIDHILPVSKGGDTTLDNCQTLCKSCNSRKGAR